MADQNAHASLKAYINKPLSLAEDGLGTALESRRIDCERCLKAAAVERAFGRGYDVHTAVLSVSGANLCAECALHSWEG